jgi:BirA family biotin operon repressor/biotin-[acetyl-CoA-carboxylase] ligase
VERFRDRILSLLRERPHSVQELAERLGVSPDLVARLLADLRALGHAIRGEGAEPLEIRQPLTEAALRAALPQHRRFGCVLEVHPVIDSTNNAARALAEAGAPEGTAVIADEQTAGRGRQGRTWFSPPERNLYLSVVLRPKVAAARAPLVTLVVAVALAEAVRREGLAPRLKWPNDLLLEGRKAAGILTEMSARGGEVAWVVAGIGLNVNMDRVHFPAALAERATSLRIAAGRDLERPALCAAILGELEQWTARFYAEGADPVLAAWRSLSTTLGRRVRVREGGAAALGLARDVDGDGALLVETEAGGTLRVIAGEIEEV